MDDRERTLVFKLETLIGWLDKVAADDEAKADEHAWAYAKLDRYDDWEAHSLSCAVSVCRSRASVSRRVRDELRRCLADYGHGG